MEVQHDLDLPVGFRAVFKPQPHELIHYLQCKANGQRLPRDGVIAEIDLYSYTAENVSNLFNEGSKTEVVYIFTTRRKKSGEIGKFDREMQGPQTSWIRISSERERVLNKEGTEVGHKNRFYLEYKDRSAIKYYMDEFTLKDAESTEYVVCEIRKKKSRRKRKEKGKKEDTNEEEGKKEAAGEVDATEKEGKKQKREQI